MVEVKHITKSFEGRVVLNDISAVFETGKTNLIIGRSGSGKTVLIKNIIGLMRPDSGEILYDGRDLTSMDKHELNMLRREMGMLYVHRYFGRYRSQPFHRNRYDTRFFRIWFTVLFQ